MKKMMLALVLTVVGLGLTTESVARCCKRACKTECAPKCAKKSCEKACTTYSESGCPVCIKAYACERQFPANKHVHTTYSCPVDCQSMPEDYSCKTELIEVGN